MKRYEQDKALMSKRAKEWERFTGIHPGATPQGRFRKRRPLDCGRARCQLCHSEKIFHRASPAQIRADEQFIQSLKDANC